MGLGNAPKVLTRGWVFVNSSLSEGLPLALGEAGLCGLPVVCTDVGGSREVISKYKPDGTLITYGRVCPPRDPMLLAQAQLETMAMLGGLQDLVVSGGPEAATPPSGSSGSSSKQKRTTSPIDKRVARLEDYPDGPSLLRRIRSQRTNCRLLGMKFREFVLSNFTMARYLREHYATMRIGEALYITRAAEKMGNPNALIQANDSDIAVVRDELLASNVDPRKVNKRGSLNDALMNRMARRRSSGLRRRIGGVEDGSSESGGSFDSETDDEREEEEKKKREEEEKERLQKKKPTFKKHHPTLQTDSRTMKRIVSVYGLETDIPKSKLAKRSLIMQEIVQTETSFVYDMVTLRDLFCIPIRTTFPNLYSREDFNELTDTLEEMLVHQSKLAKTLQAYGNISNTVTGQSSYVARTLGDYAPAMKFMASYTM